MLTVAYWLGGIIALSLICSLIFVKNDKVGEFFAGVVGFSCFLLIPTFICCFVFTDKQEKTIIEPLSVTQTNGITLVVYGNNQTLLSKDGWVYFANKNEIKIQKTEKFNSFGSSLICDRYDVIIKKEMK
jgi:uncharacterized membrane protein YkvI